MIIARKKIAAKSSNNSSFNHYIDIANLISSNNLIKQDKGFVLAISQAFSPYTCRNAKDDIIQCGTHK